VPPRKPHRQFDSIRVEDSPSSGCGNRILFDVLHTAIFLVSAAMLPAFVGTAWVLIGICAHQLGRPVPGVRPFGFLVGTLMSWSWLVTGFGFVDKWRMRRECAESHRCTVAEVRWDRRLRLRSGNTLIRLEGHWAIFATTRKTIAFPVSAITATRRLRTWTGPCFEFLIGGDNVRLRVRGVHPVLEEIASVTVSERD